MKILWVGDAVVSSGFAVCTHSICDYLHSIGHEIIVLGINYYGDQHHYPYPIHPCTQPLDYGFDSIGVTRLPAIINRYKPDVTILLNDPWNIPEYLSSIKRSGIKNVPPIIPWLAVDAKNQKGSELNDDLISRIAVWTEFAKYELSQGGCTKQIDIIPLGVDCDKFKPVDRTIWREKVSSAWSAVNTDRQLRLSKDSFVVGVVGRNQPRKRLDLSIQAFSEWYSNYGTEIDYLYLHIAPTGDQGADVKSLVKYYNIENQVIIARPEIGYGVSQTDMSEVYSSFDCLLSTSETEGWCLPVLEAMACGVPCIVPDHSAFGNLGWCGDSAIRVVCSAVSMNAPYNSLSYTIGGVIDHGVAARAIELVRSDRYNRELLVSDGLLLANRLSWYESGKQFNSMLQDFIDG